MQELVIACDLTTIPFSYAFLLIDTVLDLKNSNASCYLDWPGRLVQARARFQGRGLSAPYKITRGTLMIFGCCTRPLPPPWLRS